MTTHHVLIIEDDRSLSDVLSYNLQQEGYTVSEARDGQDGLNQAQHKTPDVVILDLMLPVIDGLEVCRRLRANQALRDVLVVMLTAKSEETDQVVGLALGADDYVTKPFSVKVLLERIKATKKPCVLCINKMDAIDPEWVLPVIEAWNKLHAFDVILPISALKGGAVDELMVKVAAHMPVHPPFFPKDQIMDGTERFVCSEIIREKLFERLSKELPYSTAVLVESFDESRRQEQKPRIEIGARILVERKSQRGIVIGKGGSMLKAIGTDARKEIQKMLGCKVHLRLHVTVSKDWTKNPRVLKELGLE